MELCGDSAVLAFTLDGIHSVTCSEIWQLRDEEAPSEVEAIERWLADGGKLNFEKIFFATANKLLLWSVTLLVRLIMHIGVLSLDHPRCESGESVET
jgi:hypothetical protein